MAQIHPSVYVAETAFISGNATIGKDSSIWPGASLRADLGGITIGRGSSIQDNAAVHMQPGMPVTIGNLVTVGHGAVIHGAVVGDNCVIGMNSTVLDGAVIGKNSIVAAGAVVKGGVVVPENSLVVGTSEVRPGKIFDPSMQWVGALLYIALSREYKNGATAFDTDALLRAAEALKTEYPLP